MAKINRKDLKHDKFVEEVGHQVEYFTEHRNTILIIAAAAVALIIGGGWYYTSSKTAAAEQMNALQQAAELFSRPVSVDAEPGQKTFVTSGERLREIGAALETVKSEHPGSEAAAAADYYAALLDIEQEDYAAAKAKLQSAIAGANEEYAALARFSLATALGSEGDTAGAREQYEALVSSPTSAVPAARAKLALARMLAKTDPEAARPLLEELAAPGSPAGIAASDELARLPQS